MRPLRHENPLLRGLERLLRPKNAHWNDEHPVDPVVIDKAHHQLGSWKPPLACCLADLEIYSFAGG